MTTGHPVDGEGRVLPRSNWPAEKCAPEPLEFVRLLCNTRNVESGADRLGHTDDLDAWLAEWGRPPVAADAVELARIVAVREALHQSMVAHRTGESDVAALAEFEQEISGVTLTADHRARGLGLVPTAPPGSAAHLLGEVAVAVVAARHDDTWSRLKACAECGWVVYDSSKNRSGRWCSMSACGGRSKARRHRSRTGG